jgi:hypothetical protein
MRRDVSPERSRDAVAQHQFRSLPHDQQTQAIRRLSLIGHRDESIAQATGMTVQQIRVALREEEEA